MSSSYDTYTEKILAYWQKAQNRQHKYLSGKTHASEIKGSCGDHVFVEAIIQNGTIKELLILSQGCCICDACCMITEEYFRGKTLSNLEHFTFENLLTIMPLEIPEERHPCMSMGWKALQHLQAIDSPHYINMWVEV